LPLPHAPEPARELAPTRFAPRRHANRLDELTVREKCGFLIFALESAGVVEIPCVSREIRGLRDIEDIALGVLELLEAERGLAASSAADHDQGRRQAIDDVLC